MEAEWSRFLGTEARVRAAWQEGPGTAAACERDARRELGQGTLGESGAIRASRTHSAGVALAVAAAGTDPRIGVDLEREDRVASDRARERVVESSEERLGLKFIDLWVIKEACYKANPGGAGSTIPQYRVTDYNGGEGFAAWRSGDAHACFRFRLVRAGGWAAALAELRKEK